LSIKAKIRSKSLNLMLNSEGVQRGLSELKRRIGGNSHEVSAFLELDDPYSYLLSHYLPALAAHYDIDLKLRLTQAMGDEYRPMADMLAEYALGDCRLLARELGVPFLDLGETPVIEHRRALLEVLAGEIDGDGFDELLLQVLAAFWRGDAQSVSRLVAGVSPDARTANVLLESNQALLEKLGHYNTATLHYAGEWYWGIDRLHYLTDRLEKLGLVRDDGNGTEMATIRQAGQLNLPMTVPASASELPPLEMFHSFRSPYSYIALASLFRIADAFGATLQIKPVLPMVMRGLPIPNQKLIYIAKDANREAGRLGIPFGNLCDPVGSGAERCIAVFYYAQSQRKEREFCFEAGKAIFSEAVDVASDKGMRIVSERAGLFWPEVQAAMQDDGWREIVQQNRDTMSDAGVWGVPVFKVGELALWGQDRDWLLARLIEDMCHSGDGFLI
jgi:2-hydroxychromene-2-carboxylate isomerase